MPVVVVGLWGLMGVGVGGSVWWLLNPPQSIQWSPQESAGARRARQFNTWIQARWNPKTRQQAQILQLPPWTILGLYALSAGAGGIVGFDFLHHVIWAVVLGGVAAWFGPAWLINKQFRGRQSILSRDFPPLVLMLRIYLDLGEPLTEALADIRPGISRIGQQEVNGLLAALHGGSRQPALKEWARRTGLPHYLLLADTLAQGWDQGLAAEMLMPLDTLIQSSRDQGTRALTDRLDGMSAFVPIIAAFGVITVLLYALLVGSGL